MKDNKKEWKKPQVIDFDSSDTDGNISSPPETDGESDTYHTS